MAELVRLHLAALYKSFRYLPPLPLEEAAGPQVFPVVSRSFPDGSTGSFYFKYSPVSNGLSFFTLANAEMATGLSVQPARLTLHLSNGGSIQSSSWTFGAALEF